MTCAYERVVSKDYSNRRILSYMRNEHLRSSMRFAHVREEEIDVVISRPNQVRAEDSRQRICRHLVVFLKVRHPI